MTHTAPDLTDLSGLVAVVTGAASGLGRAEAIGLAAAGATVVVNDIAGALEESDVLDEIAAAGSKGVAVAGDISERSTADDLDVLLGHTLGGEIGQRNIQTQALHGWHQCLRVGPASTARRQCHDRPEQHRYS